MPVPRPADEPHGLTAWKIEGNGLAKPSYLFGTFPQLYNYYWYVPELAAMFDATEVVAVELHGEELEAWEKLLAEHRRYPEGDGLEKHIPAALFKRALEAAEKVELPPSVVERNRPLFVAAELLVQ